MLAGGDEAPVRAPRRVVEQGEGLGDRAWRRAVGVHHPDIVAAAAVRGRRSGGRRARSAAACPRRGPSRSGSAARPRSAWCRCRRGRRRSSALRADVDTIQVPSLTLIGTCGCAPGGACVDVPLRCSRLPSSAWARRRSRRAARATARRLIMSGNPGRIGRKQARTLPYRSNTRKRARLMRARLFDEGAIRIGAAGA